jgi:two-component system sensor kinase
MAVQFNRDKRNNKVGTGTISTKKYNKKSDGIITILSKENEGTKVSIFSHS